MPPEVSRVAFSLKPGEVSQPFRTRFGVHLYTATAVRPGNLDLEDVRSQVIGRLSKELRDQLLGQARAGKDRMAYHRAVGAFACRRVTRQTTVRDFTTSLRVYPAGLCTLQRRLPG